MERRILIGRRLALLAVLLYGGAVSASAQSGLSCVTTASALVVHAEGVAERMGDVLLDCSGGTPSNIIKVNLTLFLTVNLTNKLTGGSLTDVQLTVDTGAGPVAAGVPGQYFAPSAVVFNGLTFTVPASGKVALRISNLRGNASQLGATPQQSIQALLTVNLPSQLSVPSNQFTVGVTQPGLLAQYSSSGVRCTGSPLPVNVNIANLFSTGTRFFSTRLTEGFASAFEVKDTLSDAGTRILARYSSFPTGSRLFVPDYVAGSSAVKPTAGGDLGLPPSGGQYAPSASGSLLLIRVVGANQTTGAGGTLAFPKPSIGTVSFETVGEVELTNGAGIAVYEVVDSNPSVRESAQFPTFLGLPSYNGPGVVATQRLSLAPLSTVNTAAAAPVPVPRFADVPPSSDCDALGDCDAAYFPHLEVTSPALNFTAPVNAFLQTQYVRVHNKGGGILNWTATITFQSGSNWLTADPASGFNDATVRIDAHPDKVPVGTYQAMLTIDAGPLAGSRTAPVTFTVTPGIGVPAPVIGAVVNGASFQTGPLVPDSYASVFGSNFTGAAVGVTFDGLPGKVAFSNATQINVLTPAELAGKTSTQVIVTVDGQPSAPAAAPVAMVSPAIFNPGILNQDNKVNGDAHPAALKSVIQIFATGVASPGSGPITARIKDRDIPKPQYGGPAPGIPGVQQVNIKIPSDLPTGTTEVRVCAIGADPNQPVCSPPASVVIGP